jgi:hypothetical protein
VSYRGRRMAHVLEDYTELRALYPRDTNEALAQRMDMTPGALQRALERARQRIRNGLPIPGSPGTRG